MANNDKKCLDDFLSKVDEIESLVKGLNSSDQDVLQKSMQQADQLIATHQAGAGDGGSTDADDADDIHTKTGFSRTVISKAGPEEEGITGPSVETGMNQDAFLAAMEADAKERAERRRVREKEALAIKERGNAEFKAGSYDKALELYSQAIEKVRDSTALYTNRAQTYIKLGRFKEALTDCDWALRVSPACLKAYIHAGRAHLGLQQYAKARDFYRQALEQDPKKKSIIEEYLSEVERAEQTAQEEKTAHDLFESGDSSVRGLVETLTKVNKPDHLPLFYSGGFRVISSLITSTEDKTLFRTNGGLTLPRDHPVLSRCLSACPVSLSKDERDMLVAAVDMLTHVCSDNEVNQEKLFDLPNIADHILQLLEVKLKGQGRMLKSSCIGLLCTMSKTSVGRRIIHTKFDQSRLLVRLFGLMQKSGVLAVKSAACLNNMALDKTFRSKTRNKMDKDIFPAFHKLVHCGSCEAAVLASAVTSMINLASDTAIRAKMAACTCLWEDSIQLLTHHLARWRTDSVHRDIVSEVLGLFLHLTAITGPNVGEFGCVLCQYCVELCQTELVCVMILERSLGLLSHILPHTAPAVEWACQNRGPELFLQQIQGHNKTNRKSALKCLTACTQSDDSARGYVVHNKGLGLLKDLLNDEDEVVVGNAALCLSHCVLVPKAAKVLTKTDIIKELLVLARDGKQSAVQQNCAILIAKLTQGDPKHLERLRELHGVEILHSCMQFIK
ncbi:tetratricopeptide repeat protein 12-like [Haliotis cracherodii]|uniref:tetratricopeptide repeat protein 12-like n=1 Tax=Haliotis cracherodii TaxID=6455 RepID=UPI0039E7707B